MHTKEEAQAVIAEYHRLENKTERLGQFLMNRMPIPINDPGLFYCQDDDLAASTYMSKYAYASLNDMVSWTRERDEDGVYDLSQTLVKAQIKHVEFKTVNTTVYCFITAMNGFVVDGKANAIVKKRFNFDVGKRRSFGRAVAALTEHMEYMVQDRIWRSGDVDAV